MFNIGPCHVAHVVSSAMVPEGTPGKWSLWAIHPERLGAIAEVYATLGAAEARAADLRQAGHNVRSIPAPWRGRGGGVRSQAGRVDCRRITGAGSPLKARTG